MEDELQEDLSSPHNSNKESYILPKKKQIFAYFSNIIGVIATVLLTIVACYLAYLSYDLANKVSKDRTDIQKLDKLITKQDETVEELRDIANKTNEYIGKQDATIDQLKTIVKGTNQNIQNLQRLITRQDATIAQLKDIAINNNDQLKILQQNEKARNKGEKRILINILNDVLFTIANAKTKLYINRDSFGVPKYQSQFRQIAIDLFQMVSVPMNNGNKFLISHRKIDSVWTLIREVFRDIKIYQYDVEKVVVENWYGSVMQVFEYTTPQLRSDIEEIPYD